jgi:nitroreductase
MLKNMIDFIKSRRSVYPKTYNDTPVLREQIEQLLEAANSAPNHKRTEPWRFRVFMGAGLTQLADFRADYYAANTLPEKFSPTKHESLRSNVLRAGAIIAIIVNFSGDVPEIEEICAVAAATQNMALAAHSLGLGGFWSTGGGTFSPECAAFLGLTERQKCLGFFFVGNHDLPPTTPQRGDVTDKTTWVL